MQTLSFFSLPLDFLCYLSICVLSVTCHLCSISGPPFVFYQWPAICVLSVTCHLCSISNLPFVFYQWPAITVTRPQWPNNTDSNKLLMASVLWWAASASADRPVNVPVCLSAPGNYQMSFVVSDITHASLGTQLDPHISAQSIVGHVLVATKNKDQE